ncbi:AMP-binding protein [Cellulomonas sp. C5510]|uniref:AMP-binding protein n=1 Tax=Cellulomonas sp. C5510 TaxID=2871170 RepID=UPI001C94F560|nr:AMP-binding protein [Cellulomonas sp. C5510]QZN86576.1 AMP-binding protein [Cellulomonas sp. C5510]
MTRAQRTAADVTSAPTLAARYANTAEPFLAAAAAHPDRPALVLGDVVVDYGTARDTVHRIARALLGQGVRRGDRVAYLLPSCPEIVELFYAVQLIGAVAVPLNVRLTAREVACLLRSCDAGTLVFAAMYTAKVDSAALAGVRMLCVDGPCTGPGVAPWSAADLGVADPAFAEGQCPVWATSLTGLQRSAPAEAPPPVRDLDAVSRIQFTGGSTGAPKGVERTHRADLVNAEGTYLSNGLDVDERKVVLIQCPLDHHAGHAWMSMGIAVGATLVLCAGFDAEAILRQVERRGVSYLILLPPSTLGRLLHHPAIGDHDLSTVRLVQSAAGGLAPDVIAAVYRRLPDAVLSYGWGQTESGLGACAVLGPEEAGPAAAHAGSVGRAMPFTEIRLVDDAGRDVAEGEVGEAVVRTGAVMTGYHGQPEATRAAFTADGWLRSGDLMRRDADGYLYLMSRRRDLIKSGGENVFAAEVDAAVRTHPGVADCVVFGVPDPVLGEAVAVAVELSEGGTAPTLTEIQDTCCARLARYKKPLHLFVLDSLDRDDAGKITTRDVIRTCGVLDAVAASSAARPALDDAYEQVCEAPDVFRIPLPHTAGLEDATLCYLLRGRERSLLVDTGSDSTAGLGLLARVLDRLGVRREDLDVLVTHEHPDHTGLVHRLRARGGRLLAGEGALAHLRRSAEPGARAAAAVRWAAAGFAADADALAATDLRSVDTGLLAEDPVGLADGAVLTVDGHDWRVLATPGHTPGSICLYQPESRVLLSGDHLLGHVTPPLCPGPSASAASDHLGGLRRVAELPVDVWLPGHGAADGPAAARARELLAHHEERLTQLADLVAAYDGATAADLVPLLRWRAVADWDAAPLGLRWLTAGQTVAYLDLLVGRGVLRRGTDGSHHRN